MNNYPRAGTGNGQAGGGTYNDPFGSAGGYGSNSYNYQGGGAMSGPKIATINVRVSKSLCLACCIEPHVTVFAI